MLTQPLPMTLDMRKLAARQTDVSGVVAVKNLPRLASLCATDEGMASACCNFFTDEEGRALLRLQVSVAVDVVCQRCLEPTRIEVETDSVLCVVAGEDKARDLPAGMDPLIVVEEPGDLWASVEDELLLSLPIVSYHTTGSCTELVEKYQVGISEPTDSELKPNPFEVLGQLKSENQE